AVWDKYGVIAPWYHGLNGQCDYRIRIAAETLKRYPWTTTNNAIAAYPDYLFTSKWQISSNGVITPQNPGDWMNGDLGQRSTSVLNGMVDYYRYSGDPAAIAHMTFMGDYLLDHALTPADHPWPKFPISVPTKGVPYGNADPHGMIQLDICGDMGRGLLRAYQVTGNKRWLEAAKHWGDLLAEKCNLSPDSDPWPRYANPEDVKWPGVNKQTGGVTMILAFLDELIRIGHTGKDGKIVAARDAGIRYLNEKLLPHWTDDDTWAFYFWDWPNPVQNCSTTADVVSYLIANQKHFPNWRNDARNILTTFLNRSSVNPGSGGDVYSGAWAYPESSSCCGRSLWYAPLMDGAIFAQYGSAANDDWARELAYRQIVLQTYDVHENGVSEDNIDGGVIVNGNWLNIAHPWPLRWVSLAIGWMPEELGASRENHCVRSSAVVNSIVYGDGEITYTTFDAPEESLDVFRLSFVPKKITVDGRELSPRRDLKSNGFTVKKLSNGDSIVQIRHDGARNISIVGNDKQSAVSASSLNYEGRWEKNQDVYSIAAKDASVSAKFYGNQIRVVGSVDQFGGKAEVFIDGEKQMVPVDYWNPAPRRHQILYYKNGLENREHTVKIVPLGMRNPYSQGDRVYVSAVQFSAEHEPHSFPSGTGPTKTQRMIFGYPQRKDYQDSNGDLWRPGVEIVTRLGSRKDSVATGWWTNAAATITGTDDPEVYRYGYHAREFWVNLTVGPGKYDLGLSFANTRGLNTQQNCFDILINGKTVVKAFDVTATAGGANKAVDLIFRKIAPTNGVVEVRFKGLRYAEGDSSQRGQAFLQALEIGRDLRGNSARPVSSHLKPPANLLLNSGFEETYSGAKGAPKAQDARAEWVSLFGGQTNSYVYQESEYQVHPDWGLPEFHSGEGAIRTHSDGDSQTTIYQDVEVKPGRTYRASVWVRAVDLRGKGFGRSSDDRAGLMLREMDASDKVLRTHPKVEVKKAGLYTLLSQTITTRPDTVKVRFALETTIKCHYTVGHVTYDDCFFGAATTDSTSR
ncbi:MAG: Di-glucose binding within endoplasmic reticulum, partial [Pedosphaera sp.]|nr:Di-glucose binding within endoplasmic reticulum [Pedosphaera sp.]